jgi:hypothetical protein
MDPPEISEKGPLRCFRSPLQRFGFRQLFRSAHILGRKQGKGYENHSQSIHWQLLVQSKAGISHLSGEAQITSVASNHRIGTQWEIDDPIGFFVELQWSIVFNGKRRGRKFNFDSLPIPVLALLRQGAQ